MIASFTHDEQQQIDRLKEKYTGVRDGQGSLDEIDTSCVSCSSVTPSVRNLGPSAQSSRSGSNVEASVCPHCHGTGTLVEIYNHRRLENFCKSCDGRGVRVFKDGVEVQPGALPGTKPLTSSTAAAPAGVIAMHSRKAAVVKLKVADDFTSDEGETVTRKAAALERDLQCIVTKTVSYNKERLDTLALLQKPHSDRVTDPDRREQAARDLIAQLDLQLERLEIARRKKHLSLQRLNATLQQRAGCVAGAATVTIDDIIANEA